MNENLFAAIMCCAGDAIDRFCEIGGAIRRDHEPKTQFMIEFHDRLKVILANLHAYGLVPGEVVDP